MVINGYILIIVHANQKQILLRALFHDHFLYEIIKQNFSLKRITLYSTQQTVDNKNILMTLKLLQSKDNVVDYLSHFTHQQFIFNANFNAI